MVGQISTHLERSAPAIRHTCWNQGLQGPLSSATATLERRWPDGKFRHVSTGIPAMLSQGAPS